MMRKITALRLLFIVCFILTVVFALFFKGNDKNSTILTIIHINDFHANYQPHKYRYYYGSKSPLALIKGYVDQVRKENPNTLFCSAGDIFEKGSIADYLSRGQSTIDIYRQLGLDLRTIGNHDFAYGLEQTLNVASTVGDITLSANQIYEKKGERWAKPYHEFFKGDIKIGVFGLVSQPFNELNENYSGHYYPDFKWRYDFLNIAREIVQKHRKDVDVLFLLSHLDDKDDKLIADMVPGIDFIIGGHSHVGTKKPYISKHGTYLVKTSHSGSYIGRLDVHLDIKAKKIIKKKYSYKKVHPLFLKSNTLFENKIEKIVKKYAPNAYTTICNTNRELDNDQLSLVSAKAIKKILQVDAVIFDKEAVWSKIPKGDISNQILFDAFKVEIQPPGTVGFTSIKTGNIMGKDLTQIKEKMNKNDFIYQGVEKIEQQANYTLATHTKIALNMEHFFPGIKNGLSDLKHQSELWELVAQYCHEQKELSGDIF